MATSKASSPFVPSTTQWWGTGSNSSDNYTNTLQNQNNSVNNAVLSALGIGGTNTGTSYQNNLSTYQQPPNNNVQQAVIQLSGNNNIGYTMQNSGIPQGGYVFTATSGPNAGSQYYVSEQGHAWSMQNGQLPMDEINFVSNNPSVMYGTGNTQASIPSVGTMGQTNVNQTPVNPSTLASNAMPFNSSANSNYNTGQTVGQLTGATGGYYPQSGQSIGTQSGMTALNNLDAMLNNSTVQQTEQSISNSLANPQKVPDKLRNQLSSNIKDRNTRLRDQQLSDIQKKAAASGVGRQDMSNSAVAQLNSELAYNQAQADANAAFTQATENWDALQDTQTQGLNWANLLNDWGLGWGEIGAQQQLANSGNLWNWLISSLT